MIGPDEVSLALDDAPAAVVAISVVAFVAGNVADVCVADALGHGDFPESLQEAVTWRQAIHHGLPVSEKTIQTN